MARFDAKRLSRLDWVVVATAAVALVSVFLPWYGASVAGFSASVSGWSTGYGWVGALLVVAAGVYLLLQRSEVNLSSMPAGPAVIVLVAGAIGAFLVIVRWITLPRGHAGFGGTTVFSYGPRVGIWFTMIAGVVQVVAAVMIFRESGEKAPWSKP